ncbi:class I SAM-dependent methyltransferase [Alkaliphilus peptidifermentans]|uniref:Putative rRNA methylase n=1 Tax=Alkaliphilus peptidifermentans DSM 18978 TaxID=1120976 RepID=A0A1G5KMX8_9FIRM|nr:class I SAM-dependent methyltransferase [Alkaliphilus peptidifermentans]SCZ01440.1 Putative rRNA methylase [Alkaliphilus peptidifermentans DSM 18978]
MDKLIVSRATAFVHTILKEKIKPGNVVVDATMGNGNDTIFLAESVGNSGKVYSFDIQEKAMEATSKKLREFHAENLKQVFLIRDSHENMGIHINEKIDAAVFNLGYLPGGDRRIVTQPNSTIKAIEYVLENLNPMGVLSVMIYYGHDGGLEEKNTVLEHLTTLDNKKYSVLQCGYINKDKNPPIIVFVEKIN